MSIYSIKNISLYLDKTIETWNNNYPNYGVFSKASLSNIVLFLINCLDESINLAEESFKEGKDKKAAVLLIISCLFDKIVAKSLPIYLVPFQIAIKIFVVQILSSILIDFIVDKYNRGVWKMKNKAEGSQI